MEGDRYELNNEFTIDLLPRPSDPCALNPSADGCVSDSGGTDVIMFAAIGVILSLIHI